MNKLFEKIIIAIGAIGLGFLFYLVANQGSCDSKGVDLQGLPCVDYKNVGEK